MNSKGQKYKMKMVQYLYKKFPFLKNMIVPVEKENQTENVSFQEVIDSLVAEFYETYDQKKTSD